MKDKHYFSRSIRHLSKTYRESLKYHVLIFMISALDSTNGKIRYPDLNKGHQKV
jgi:hypothetical protein